MKSSLLCRYFNHHAVPFAYTAIAPHYLVEGHNAALWVHMKTNLVRPVKKSKMWFILRICYVVLDLLLIS